MLQIVQERKQSLVMRICILFHANYRRAPLRTHLQGKPIKIRLCAPLSIGFDPREKADDQEVWDTIAAFKRY